MKQGLGDSYENVSVLPVKLRAWLDLTKPASSLGVGGAFFLASLFYFYYIGQPNSITAHIFDIIYASITAILAHGASQVMNMAEDAEMDAETEHKKSRPIPSGIVTVEEARTIAWILMLLAIGRAYLINSAFGVLTSVLVFMGIFYNLDPIRAKERVISIPWQAVSRGFMMFPMVWAAYGSITDPTPWALGAVMFFYVLAFQNSADIIDREVDEKYGVKTLVVVWGVRDTVIFAGASTCFMVFALLTGISLGFIPEKLITMSLIIVPSIYMLAEMWIKPYKVSDRTGNHPAWLAYYFGMVLFVLIPLLTEIAL